MLGKMETSMKKMYHVVLLKFAANKAHRAADVFAELDALRATIPGFLTFTGGPYSSPEGLHQGYTHGCVMTFMDAAARNGYLTHPDHELVKQRILPDVEGVVAFDFEGV
jgi:Stress responsive A/B Barrel Domain